MIDGEGIWSVKGDMQETRTALNAGIQAEEFALFPKSNGDGDVLVNPMLVEAATLNKTPDD
jgi:hypothetical protein